MKCMLCKINKPFVWWHAIALLAFLHGQILHYKQTQLLLQKIIAIQICKQSLSGGKKEWWFQNYMEWKLNKAHTLLWLYNYISCVYKWMHYTYLILVMHMIMILRNYNSLHIIQIEHGIWSIIIIWLWYNNCNTQENGRIATLRKK